MPGLYSHDERVPAKSTCRENFLRYLITYKIKTGEKNSLGQIELELDKEPTFMDEAILDAAMKDSIKLTESRMIALSIKSIQPIN